MICGTIYYYLVDKANYCITNPNSNVVSVNVVYVTTNVYYHTLYSYLFFQTTENVPMKLFQHPDQRLEYAVAGRTESFSAVSTDFWILKLASDGTVQWQRRYGGSDEELAYSIIQTSDGGYAVAGSTQSFGAGSRDFWVLKLNTNGLGPGCGANTAATVTNTNATVNSTTATVTTTTSSAPTTNATTQITNCTVSNGCPCP